MQFFTEAVNVLKTLVIALGAGLAVWGVVNLFWRDTATIIPAQSRRELNSLWRAAASC